MYYYLIVTIKLEHLTLPFSMISQSLSSEFMSLLLDLSPDIIALNALAPHVLQLAYMRQI
jgi:hypothetical protein